MSEILWLNKETLEERYLDKFSVFPYRSSWVEVPEGVTFATGDKDDYVFRKDGWYYKDGEWIKGNVTIKNLSTHKFVKLFWVKSDVKGGILSNNFTVAWEQVFGEKFADSVIKAVKQNKDSTMKNDMFTLERLLGSEVAYKGVNYWVTSIYNISKGKHLILYNGTHLAYMPDLKLLTFFTEDGDELTFDEYVNMYYGGSV